MTDGRFGWQDGDLEFDVPAKAVPQAVSDRERLYAVIAAAITPEQLAAVRETVRAVADPALRADMSDVLASQAAALGLL